MSEREGVDRRFDPRFQRGHAAERGPRDTAPAPADPPRVEAFRRPGSEPAPATTGGSAGSAGSAAAGTASALAAPLATGRRAAASALAGGPTTTATSFATPTPTPPVTPVLPVVAARPGVAPTRPAVDGDTAPDPDPVFADELPPAGRRPNPFAIALLVVSIASLAGGVAMIWRSVTDPELQASFPNAGVNDALLQFLMATAPPALIAAGMLGVILWLAVMALRPRGPLSHVPVEEHDVAGSAPAGADDGRA